MLILTRKPGESLYIGDKVKVTIVEIKGNQIRVGIEAPSDLRIYREEIYLQILDENRKAAEGMMLDSPLDQLSGGWKGVAKSGDAQPGKPASKGAAGLQGRTSSMFLKRKAVGSEKDIQKVVPPKKEGE
jgi:carbon storage regulator